MTDRLLQPGGFFQAFLLPLRAVAFILRRRALWPYVAVPALINGVLFVLGAALVFAFADDLLAALGWARPAAEGALGLLLAVLWAGALVLLVGVGLAATYVLVLLLGSVVASPFNDALSEQVELALTGGLVRPAGGFWQEAWRSLRSSVLVLLFYAACMIPVLLLGAVPVAGGVVAAAAGALVSAFFLTLEYTDAVLVRRGFTLGARLRLLRRVPARTFGFGLGTALLLWVPLLNFFCIPVAVVAGTALGLQTARTA